MEIIDLGPYKDSTPVCDECDLTQPMVVRFGDDGAYKRVDLCMVCMGKGLEKVGRWLEEKA